MPVEKSQTPYVVILTSPTHPPNPAFSSWPSQKMAEKYARKWAKVGYTATVYQELSYYFTQDGKTLKTKVEHYKHPNVDKV